MEGAGLNITVLSYMDNVDIGFMACRELIPDVWSLAGYVQDSMDELLAAIGQPRTKPAKTKAPGKKKGSAKKVAEAAAVAAEAQLGAEAIDAPIDPVPDPASEPAATS